MQGTGAGVFSPDRPLTRGMFATILARYARLQGKDMTSTVELSTFSDAASIPGAYADGIMLVCVQPYCGGGAPTGPLPPRPA